MVIPAKNLRMVLERMDAASLTAQRHRCTEAQWHIGAETKRHRGRGTEAQTHRHRDTESRIVVVVVSPILSMNWSYKES